MNQKSEKYATSNNKPPIITFLTIITITFSMFVCGLFLIISDFKLLRALYVKDLNCRRQYQTEEAN